MTFSVVNQLGNYLDGVYFQQVVRAYQKDKTSLTVDNGVNIDITGVKQDKGRTIIKVEVDYASIN